MQNTEGPMGRAAYEFTPEEFGRLTLAGDYPEYASVSWASPAGTVEVIGDDLAVNFTLHGFKAALGITDNRGEVIEVNLHPDRVQVVMSDRELSS